VTPDSERQAWREAVRAFRLAATMLKDPAPRLFAELAAPEEGLRELTQELPLVAFSPFGALPDDVAYDRDGELHRPAADSGPISDRATGPGTVRSRRSGAPGGSRDILRATPSRADQPTDEPLVFSFRRSGASGREQPPLRSGDVRKDPMSGSTIQGHFRAAESKQGDREEPAAAETHPDAYVPAGSGAATDTRDLESGRWVEMLAAGEYRSIHPMTLLDSLAEDALGTEAQRTPDSLVAPSGVSTSRPARSPESRGKVGDETRDHTPSEFGSSRVATSSQGPVDSFSDAARSRDPGLLASSPDHVPHGAVAMIDALAEHLLAPNDQVAGSPPASEVRDGGAAGAVHDRSPLTSLDGADREPAGRSPSGSGRPDPDPNREAASDPYIDAETFATLVNDVLIRQARRHGVDLS
jgi:hypothetical protein